VSGPQGGITPIARARDPIDPGVPPEQWPRDAEGHIEVAFGPDLDLDGLLRELDRGAPG
jgi:hypothetical protein